MRCALFAAGREAVWYSVMGKPHRRRKGTDLTDRVISVEQGNPVAVLARQFTLAARLAIKLPPVFSNSPESKVGSRSDAQNYLRMVYSHSMRTNIDINESLVRKARKLTRLKTKRQIVDKALELLVRSESRKGILQYYGSGIWKGGSKAMRRNRV